VFKEKTIDEKLQRKKRILAKYSGIRRNKKWIKISLNPTCVA